MMQESVITEQGITELVHRFYTKIRADDALGPIFLSAIGEDEQDWKPHLQRMVDFWSSIMLGTGAYSGNPFKKHKDLPSFDMGLFDRWLTLFSETAHELYSEEQASNFIEKGTRIAESLKLGLYYRPDAPIA